jgi:hypothetical protein
MKFKVLHEFRSGPKTFEAGNTYDADKHAEATDEKVGRWYAAGFVELEGVEPPPPVDPQRRVTLAPEKVLQHIRGGK